MPVILFITLSLSVFCAVVLGDFLSLFLPVVHPFFDRKPFNCRPCFTFHLTWMLTSLFAWMYSSLLLFGVGAGVAFIVFMIIKYIDNQKIEE